VTKKELMKKEYLVSMLLSLAQLAALIGLSSVLSHALGVEEFGIYAISVSAILILSVFTQMGLTDIILKETSLIVNDPNGNNRGMWRLWNSVDSIVAGPTLLVFLLFFLWFNLQYVDWITALLAASQIPLVTFLSLRVSAMRGLGRSNTAHFFFSVFPYGFAAVSLSSIYHLRGDVHISEAFWLILLGSLISLGVVQFLREKSGDGNRFDQMRRRDKAHIVRQSLPMMGVASLSMFNSQVDILFLGVLSGAGAAGIYQAALQITMALNLIKIKLATVVSHKVAVLARQKQFEEIVCVMRPITLVTTGLSITLFVVVFLFGREILSGLFGPEFIAAWLPALIVSASLIIASAAGPVGSLMIMSGYQKDAMHSSIGAALVNVLLNPIFILWIGHVGAAITLFISVVWWHVSMIIKSRKKLGIDVTLFSVIKAKSENY
jgi:O-antigen/teichoic acid export membrane protein